MPDVTDKKLPELSAKMVKANEDHVVHSLQSLQYLRDHNSGIFRNFHS